MKKFALVMMATFALSAVAFANDGTEHKTPDMPEHTATTTTTKNKVVKKAKGAHHTTTTTTGHTGTGHTDAGHGTPGHTHTDTETHAE